MRKLLPFSVLATGVVVGAPALIVAAMPGSPGPLIGFPACVILSLVLARAAAAVWRRSPRSREVLFADLMLWGWARRALTERRLARAEDLVRGNSEDAERRLRALQRVSAMLESRDSYTRRHSLRVTRYSEAIARALGLADGEVAQVRQAAELHDVGKFFTPREILNKPGRLTAEEFAVIERHPGDGADMLQGVVEPTVEAMIRHHHERLGGTGYPGGLAGDAIPLGARIIAIADTFDAMTSTRPYRSARPHRAALAVLREEAGVALDARAAAAFEEVYSGRRGVAFSSIASGMTQALAPLRELILPAARALPALGATAVLTAPVVLDGGAPRPGDARDNRAAQAGTGPTASIPGGDPARPARRAGRLDRRASFARPRASERTAPVSRPVPVSAGEQAPSTDGGAWPDPVEPAQPAPTPGSAPPADEPPAGGSPGMPEPAPTSAPTAEPAAPAATPAPEITTEDTTVGPVTVPGVEIDVPDLPVAVPSVHVPSAPRAKACGRGRARGRCPSARRAR